MNRSEFVKKLVALFGVAALPKKWVKQYEKIYLLQCFVRGFQFHKGIELLAGMKVGDMLELVREPLNSFDDCAIALHYNQQKIGFVPRESNEILSRLLDSKLVDLHAEITHLEPAAKSWENIHLGIYLLREVSGTAEVENQYLTQLETPHYLTLKQNNNHISKIQFLDEDEDPEPALTAGAYSPDKELPQDLLYVLNRKTNKLDAAIDDLFCKIDGEILELDDFFAEDGYVVANVEHLSAHPDLVKNLVQVADRRGNKMIEIILDPIHGAV